jgi:hypothetical protein
VGLVVKHNFLRAALDYKQCQNEKEAGARIKMFINSFCYEMSFFIFILTSLREDILFTSKIHPIWGVSSSKGFLFSFFQLVSQTIVYSKIFQCSLCAKHTVSVRETKMMVIESLPSRHSP